MATSPCLDLDPSDRLRATDESSARTISEGTRRASQVPFDGTKCGMVVSTRGASCLASATRYTRIPGLIRERDQLELAYRGVSSQERRRRGLHATRRGRL